MAMADRYPDFLCIGAQKAGTTWLSRNLVMHPEIWMPPKKEVHYFDHIDDPPMHPLCCFLSPKLRTQFKWQMKAVIKNLSFVDLRWNMNYFFGSRDDDWYRSLFTRGTGKVVGEITPAYSTLDKEKVRYVYHLMPEAKILFLLRNPIERAWSHAVMDLSVLAGRSVHTIDEAEFIRHFDSRESRLRGDYQGVIDNWLSVYPEKQFFIGFIEDVARQPEELLRSIFRFLGVSDAENSIGEHSRKKIHEGRRVNMPPVYKEYLEEIYQEPVKRLSGYFEGREAEYVKSWIARD